jgi:hypothetical protein
MILRVAQRPVQLALHSLRVLGKVLHGISLEGEASPGAPQARRRPGIALKRKPPRICTVTMHNVHQGFGGWGLQTNVPISIAHGRHVIIHWNTGLTWVPSAQDSAHNTATLVNPNPGQSTVFLIKPTFNALCELVWSSNATVTGPDQTTRTQNLFVNPGIRWAHNLESGLQIVPGVGVPIGIGPGSAQRGLIF